MYENVNQKTEAADNAAARSERQRATEAGLAARERLAKLGATPDESKTAAALADAAIGSAYMSSILSEPRLSTDERKRLIQLALYASLFITEQVWGDRLAAPSPAAAEASAQPSQQ